MGFLIIFGAGLEPSAVAAVCGAILGIIAIIGFVSRTVFKLSRAADDWQEISAMFKYNREGTSIPQRLDKIEDQVGDLILDKHGKESR